MRRPGFKRLIVALSSIIFLVSCDKNEDRAQSTETVTVATYNDMVRKHNDLVKEFNDLQTSSWAASTQYVEYVQASKKMNKALEEFASLVESFLNESVERQRLSLPKVKVKFETGLAAIHKVESALLAQYKRVRELAPTVYKNGTAVLEKLDLENRQSNLLYGILRQHQALWNIAVTTLQSRDQNVLNNQSASSQPSVTVGPKAIALTEAEQSIGQVSQGGGLWIGKEGKVQSGSSASFETEASARGFSRAVVTDAVKMAESFNGVAAMACTERDLVAALNAQIGHMKTVANRNSDDFEVVLAVDYSGSMGNNIRAVIEGLQSFVNELTNVRQAGRAVRVGIVTFGEPSKERIELELTENMVAVSARLSVLLRKFGSNTHSTQIGEASHHGLLKSTEMNWASPNRQIILITDEPSYSLQSKHFAFIREVEQKLADSRVYPLVVRLCD